MALLLGIKGFQAYCNSQFLHWSNNYSHPTIFLHYLIQGDTTTSMVHWHPIDPGRIKLQLLNPFSFPERKKYSLPPESPKPEY